MTPRTDRDRIKKNIKVEKDKRKKSSLVFERRQEAELEVVEVNGSELHGAFVIQPDVS